MSTDYKGRRPQKSKGVLHSFHFALQGLTHTIANERNMRIHVVISIVVVICGFLVRLTALEWLFILFAIGGVFTLELLNTALERIVDLVTEDFHPLAKQAKDIAAAAVFVYAILSIIAGMIIFVPKLF
jgi:undecaprenol kinase